MAGTNPDLVIRVAANVAALQTDMAAAVATLKAIEGAATTTAGATASLASSSDSLGHSWVLRIAEGQLLRDAVREVLAVMKELVLFFPELAMRGAVIGDVQESFEHLATSAGLVSTELLGTLRAGVHGTIDDFTLMQRTNKDLAAGLNLTQDEFGLLTQGAFALSKATGTDVKTALDSMSDAMVTGRTKAIALLTGKVDLKAAEEAFAESLGGTAKNLTAEGKLEADRQAILAAVATGLARVGEQTDSLDEKVTQGKVAWTNFINDLGVAIAQSPVLAAGLDSVKASLLAAFGGDQKALIAAIAKGVTDAAIVVVDFGIGAAAVAGAFVQVWYGIKTAVLAVETVIVGLVTAIGEVLLAADKMAGKLHLVDDAEVAKMQATQDALRGMTVGLAAETAEAAKGALGQSALNQTIDKGTGILLTMRDSMIAAQAAQEAQTTSTAAFIGPIQQAGVALKAHGDYLKEDAEAAKKYADAWVELTSMGNGFAETMATINPKILQEIQYYLQAGASVHTLAAAYPELSTAQVTAVEEWNKANIRVSAELTKVSDEYYKAVNAASHDSVQRQIDDAYLTASTRIAQMEKTKSYSVEAELLIWKTAEQTSDNIIAKTLESDVHSRAHFELIADQAKNAYDFAQAHADQYTSEWIVQLQKTADAARLAADTFGVSFDGALGKVDAHIGATLGAFHQLAMASAAATIPAGATSKYPDTIEGRLAMLADQQAQDPTRFINTSGLFAGVPMTQARAGGGDVGAGQPYLVGERGPELFVPQSNGSIVPNSGGGDVNVKIYVNGTAADVARQVAAELTRTMKTARKYA